MTCAGGSGNYHKLKEALEDICELNHALLRPDGAAPRRARLLRPSRGKPPVHSAIHRRQQISRHPSVRPHRAPAPATSQASSTVKPCFSKDIKAALLEKQSAFHRLHSCDAEQSIFPNVNRLTLEAGSLPLA
jgi:hypothetical protein